MIDLTEFFRRADVGIGIMLIVLLLTFIFFAKFPKKKSS